MKTCEKKREARLGCGINGKRQKIALEGGDKNTELGGYGGGRVVSYGYKPTGRTGKGGGKNPWGAWK